MPLNSFIGCLQVHLTSWCTRTRNVKPHLSGRMLLLVWSTTVKNSRWDLSQPLYINWRQRCAINLLCNPGSDWKQLTWLGSQVFGRGRGHVPTKSQFLTLKDKSCRGQSTIAYQSLWLNLTWCNLPYNNFTTLFRKHGTKTFHKFKPEKSISLKLVLSQQIFLSFFYY